MNWLRRVWWWFRPVQAPPAPPMSDVELARWQHDRDQPVEPEEC